MMLQKLMDVDWAQLETAYGSAEAVPDLLRALMSDHPADWSEAMFALEGTILHQGSVCRSTVASIPFLLELLFNTGIHCRGHILSFLNGAIGGFYTGLSTEEASKSNSPFYPSDGSSSNDAAWIKKEDNLRRDCARQVWQQWEMLLALLGDSSLPVRLHSPLLLSMLVSRRLDCVPPAIAAHDPAKECLEQLHQRLKIEKHILVRASLIFGLAQLFPQNSEVLPILQEHLAEEYSSQERLAAAWNLAQQGQELPEEAILFLAETLRNFAQTDHLFEPDFPGIEWRYHPIKRAVWGLGIPTENIGEESDDPADWDANEDVIFPWANGWPRFNTIACLCRQKYEQLPSLEAALLEALKSESPHTTDCISHPILQFLFQCSCLSQDMETLVLSPAQEKALTVLYDNPLLWTTNISQWVFDDFGLPLHRQRWSRLLRKEDYPYSGEDAFGLLESLVRENNHLPADATLRVKDWHAVRWLAIRTLCSDALLPLLERLTNLEALDLSHSHVTDAGLQMLPALPKLRSLYLINTPITDAGLEFLRHLDSLEEVILSERILSAEGLNQLAVLPELKLVRLFNTSISDQDAANFQSKKPQCKVELIERG